MYIRIAAVVLLALGIVTLLVFALADIVGIGGDPNVFGYLQMRGSILGVAIAVVGGVLYWLSGRK